LATTVAADLLTAGVADDLRVMSAQ
jgi:hypothetical protein